MQGASKYSCGDANPDEDPEPEIDENLFPKVKNATKLTSASGEMSINSLQAHSSESAVLARDELNLLAKLIGTDVRADQQDSKGAFRINLLELDDSKDTHIT